MSGNKKSVKTNKKINNRNGLNKSKSNNKTKFAIVGGACIALIIAIVCVVIFVPKDDDANYPSSYPDYFSNLKEEKEAFSKALATCNKAAESKLAAKGIKTQICWFQ